MIDTLVAMRSTIDTAGTLPATASRQGGLVVTSPGQPGGQRYLPTRLRELAEISARLHLFRRWQAASNSIELAVYAARLQLTGASGAVRILSFLAEGQRVRSPTPAGSKGDDPGNPLLHVARKHWHPVTVGTGNEHAARPQPDQIRSPGPDRGAALDVAARAFESEGGSRSATCCSCCANVRSTWQHNTE